MAVALKSICATFHPVSPAEFIPAEEEGYGGSTMREMKKKQLSSLSLSYSALLLLCPPLEMILHRRTRLDGAISPMKSNLFLGPFSSFGRAAVGASLPPSVPRRRTGGEEEEARRNWEERRWEGRERGNSSGLNFQQSEREGGREGSEEG